MDYGVKSLKFKTLLGADTLSSIGQLKNETLKFTSVKATLNKFYAAQTPDYPTLIIKDQEGEITLAGTIQELDMANCARLFGGAVGGTVAAPTWSPATVSSNVEVNTEMVTETGLVITFPRMLLQANWNWSVDRKNVVGIDFTMTVLLPTDGSEPYTIGGSPSA
jgi:hypothetical protein